MAAPHPPSQQPSVHTRLEQLISSLQELGWKKGPALQGAGNYALITAASDPRGAKKRRAATVVTPLPAFSSSFNTGRVISKRFEIQHPLRPPSLFSPTSRSVSESDSVMSGLYSPWNSPGLNTGVGSLSLLQGIFQPRSPTLQADSLPPEP